MYVGQIMEINQTPGAIKITIQGEKLDGRMDRTVYLPKSQIQIRRRKSADGGFNIYIPDWLITKNRINWNRIQEIEPISPRRN